MNTKISSYDPMSSEIVASSLLISIKQAAERNECCEGTLKVNAKARRLRAFQQYFGAPVMVLPSDAEVFLKSRPDIASKYHPKGCPAVSAAGQPSTASTPQTYCLSPFPDPESSCGPIGDFGISITLRSLAHTTPAQRALVAKTLFEIARAINDTVPADSGNQPQHTI